MRAERQESRRSLVKLMNDSHVFVACVAVCGQTVSVDRHSEGDSKCSCCDKSVFCHELLFDHVTIQQ